MPFQATIPISTTSKNRISIEAMAHFNNAAFVSLSIHHVIKSDTLNTKFICSIEGTRKVYHNLKRKGCNVQMIEWPDFLHEIHNGNAVSRGDEVIDSMIQYILS